jgi:hypothetical protein
VLRAAKTIDTGGDAALLALYYWVPESIGLTLFESGLRDRSGFEDGMRYWFDNHLAKKPREEGPGFILFKQFALHHCREFTPSGKGSGGKKRGNSRLLIDRLDTHMGQKNSVSYGASWMTQRAITAERRGDRETEYRFRWRGGEFSAWKERSDLQNDACQKALKSMEKEAKKVKNWL